eukprot:m.488306 g.488306  ORF g.488306 m.488306 type:complete len:219 (+) comp57233_c3_seq26:1595-2251(+)
MVCTSHARLGNSVKLNGLSQAARQEQCIAVGAWLQIPLQDPYVGNIDQIRNGLVGRECLRANVESPVLRIEKGLDFDADVASNPATPFAAPPAELGLEAIGSENADTEPLSSNAHLSLAARRGGAAGQPRVAAVRKFDSSDQRGMLAELVKGKKTERMKRMYLVRLRQGLDLPHIVHCFLECEGLRRSEQSSGDSVQQHTLLPCARPRSVVQNLLREP